MSAQSDAIGAKDTSLPAEQPRKRYDLRKRKAPIAAPDSRSRRKRKIKQQSPFFRLPAELRNIIYRLVLVQPNEHGFQIAGTETLPDQPALLQTCRQIRNDAREMYFQQNEFIFNIVDFDAGPFIKWCRVSDAHRTACAWMSINGAPNWSNLKAWVEHYYFGRVFGFTGEVDWPSLSLTTSAAFRVFEVATTEMARLPGQISLQDWSELEITLEHLHKMMATFDPRWK